MHGQNQGENPQHGKISTISQDKGGEMVCSGCAVLQQITCYAVYHVSYTALLFQQSSTFASQHSPCHCSSESAALRRPHGGRSSEIPPLMGKAETSTVPGLALRTGDTKQSSERFRFTNGNRTLISDEVQSLGVLPAHTRENSSSPICVLS